MTMKKRITSFALVLLMVLSSLAVLLPVTGVKAAAAGETKTYTKVTTAPNDWSGEYLIVYETDKVAFDGSRTTLDATGNTQVVTIENNTITLDSNAAYYFTIAKNETKTAYTIKSASGCYIGRTAKSNGLNTSTKTAYDNNIEITNGYAIIKSKETTLKFNSDKGQTRFRYYASGQEDIQLYKLEEASEHVHEYNDTWSSDNQYHWHQCIKDSKCTVVDSKAAHTPDTTVSAYKKDTDTANHYFKCATCGEEYSVAHSSDTYLPTQDKSQHYQVCDVCSAEFNKGAHNWETDTEATDVPDGKLAQKCSVCGEKRTVDKPNEPETIDFSTKNLKDTAAVTKVEQNGFVINFENSKYYANGTAIRVYTGGTITVVAPAGKLITGIVFKFTEKKYSNISAYGYSDTTWTGTAQSVTFSATAQSRIKTISITTIDAPEFKYATLDVKENIDVNFYVSVPNGYDVANLKTFFNFHRADTSVVGEPVNTENGLLYRFTLKDVAPHLMGENITATLKNGDTVIATLDYSINTYLDNQKKDTTLSDSTKALIESIAAYGDKAADYNNKISDSTTFTGTATADPADMTESKPTIGTTLEGFRFKGVAVRMENNIRIRVSFENTSGAELKFFVKVGDGKETEAILSNGYVYTDLIAPSAYDTEYTIIAKNAGGETVGTVSLSVNTYVCMVLKAFPADGTLTNAQAAMRELAIAIYNYGKAAKTAIGA